MERTKKCTLAEAAALLPWPAADANKYSRGKAVLVAGSARFPGAACLAAAASQRTGAGYTEVVCAPEALAQVRASSPSLVAGAWDDLLAFAQADEDELAAPDPAAARCRAVHDALFAPAHPGRPRAYLVGSGLDARDPASAALANAVLAHAPAPVVVDGGALDALAQPEGRLALRRRFLDGLPTAITPHAGEAARLAAPLQLPTGDPAALAWLLSLAYGVTAMVKGPTTYISDGERTVRMDAGTPALAKAGTGDVLAGMAVALLAQGLSAMDACMLAAVLHARAGQAAAKRLTDICVMAEDVAAAIPDAVRMLAENG